MLLDRFLDLSTRHFLFEHACFTYVLQIALCKQQLCQGCHLCLMMKMMPSRPIEQLERADQQKALVS